MRSRLFALALFCMCMLVGCKEVRNEASPVLHENAVVLQTVFTPSEHHVGLGFRAFDDPLGMGSYDWGGNHGIPITDDLQVSHSSVPEKYAVVFQCQHGQFIIERKEIYQRFQNLTGSTADVTYREIYRATYEKENGEKHLVDRVLVDFDFLNAVLKEPMTQP